MFELEYMKVYSGSELANALRYNCDSSDIAKYLQAHYKFIPRVNLPRKPAKWATRMAWNEYNFQLAKYRRYQSEVKSTVLYVLDTNANYVITRNKGKIWVNYVICKKTISQYSPDLYECPEKFIGYYVEGMDCIIVLHDSNLYAYNLSTGVYTKWSDN